MKIRNFKKEDAKEVCGVITRCDEEIASKDYPKKIIDWWVSKLTPELIIGKSENRYCPVAVFNGHIVGYASLEGNEIKKLHVNPDYHGKGIGRRLIQKIEDFSVKHNINNLIVESSIYAEKFYEKCGFSKIKINYCKHDDEKYKLILMEKKLK